MLVVVCGMHRSGSTLVAQLVRGLLEAQSKPVTISTNGLGDTVEQMRERAADPDRIWLAKVHQQARRFREGLPDDGAVYFYTYRDMRDALASAWRKNRLQIGDPERSAKALQDFIRTQIKAAKAFEPRHHLWMGKYEEFVHDLEGLTHQLAAALQIQPSPTLVATLIAAARPDEQRKRVQQLMEGDRTVRASTFITSNHITDGREGAWKDTLTVAEAQLAENLARTWLKAKGYALCFRRDPGATVAPLRYGKRRQPDNRNAEPKQPPQRQPRRRWWPFAGRC